MVAGKRIAPADTARIRVYIEDAENPRTNGDIATLMGVSKRTIERLRLNFELFDAPYPPPSVKLGRPTILTEAQQGFVLEFFTQRPYAHFADARDAIWERFDVNCSAKTIANILWKNNWTRRDKKGSVLQAPGAARDHVPDSTETRDESFGSASRPVASQAQDDALDLAPQPMATPTPEPEVPPAPSPVMLPEISLPAFYLQSAVSPTNDHTQPAVSAPRQRVPCPTCGCSSREHQNS